jgi:hypothetical protein
MFQEYLHQNHQGLAAPKLGQVQAATLVITEHTAPAADQVRQIQVVAEALVVAAA